MKQRHFPRDLVTNRLNDASNSYFFMQDCFTGGMFKYSSDTLLLVICSKNVVDEEESFEDLLCLTSHGQVGWIYTYWVAAVVGAVEC